MYQRYDLYSTQVCLVHNIYNNYFVSIIEFASVEDEVYIIYIYVCVCVCVCVYIYITCNSIVG